MRMERTQTRLNRERATDRRNGPSAIDNSHWRRWQVSLNVNSCYLFYHQFNILKLKEVFYEENSFNGKHLVISTVTELNTELSLSGLVCPQTFMIYSGGMSNGFPLSFIIRFQSLTRIRSAHSTLTHFSRMSPLSLESSFMSWDHKNHSLIISEFNVSS